MTSYQTLLIIGVITKRVTIILLMLGNVAHAKCHWAVWKHALVCDHEHHEWSQHKQHEAALINQTHERAAPLNQVTRIAQVVSHVLSCFY